MVFEGLSRLKSGGGGRFCGVFDPGGTRTAMNAGNDSPNRGCAPCIWVRNAGLDKDKLKHMFKHTYESCYLAHR